MVCALDHDWRPAWRVALIDSYKTHRLAPDGGEEVPDNSSRRSRSFSRCSPRSASPPSAPPDYEADDVHRHPGATREPGPVEIATGDRDLLQLIDDATGYGVLYCGKGVAKLEVCDDAAVAARYGVPAGRYADFAALRGDPSDGLPGVPGIGEKTAARLVARYGGLAAIVAALDDPGAGSPPGCAPSSPPPATIWPPRRGRRGRARRPVPARLPCRPPRRPRPR